MSAEDARPVRTLANSALACVTAFCILSSLSERTRSMSSLMRSPRPLGPHSPDQRTDRLAEEDGPYVALGHEIEHHDRQLVLHAERHRGWVHRAQAAVDDLDVADFVELRRVGVEPWIVGVDA